MFIYFFIFFVYKGCLFLLINCLFVTGVPFLFMKDSKIENMSRKELVKLIERAWKTTCVRHHLMEAELKDLIYLVKQYYGNKRSNN